MPPVEFPDNPAHRLDREATRLGASGRDVLRLHIGDSDLPTPSGLQEAVARALAAGMTHYAPPEGLPGLRRAIADRWRNRHHVPVGPDGVVVLPAKFAIYATIAATIDPGDEVLFPDPSYFFEEPVRLGGGVPTRFPLRDDHSLDLDGLAEAIGPRTRLLALVTPGNPTGRVLRKDELRAAAEIAAHHHLTVLSDEAYAELVYDGNHVAFGSVAPPELPVVTVGSFSKTFAMSGWRAGFALAPPELAERIVRIVEHTLTCVPPFIQHACQWGLEHGDESARQVKEQLRQRRDDLLGRLDDLAGIRYQHPDGGMYVFPAYDLELPSVDFALQLLAEQSVAVAPGAAFGPRGEGHLRIAFAAPAERLDLAAQRLGEFLERHGASRG